MENPAYWTPAERVIADALGKHQAAMAAGLIGRSSAKAIADALREANLLREDY